MQKLSKFLMLVLFFALISTLELVPARAAEDGFLQYPGADNPDDICSHGYVSIQSVYTPTANDFDGVDMVGIALVDGNGTLLGAYVSASSPDNGIVTLDSTLPLGIVNGAVNDITARPVTWQLYDTTLTYDDIDGWGQQQIFDALEQDGILLDDFSYDPAFVLNFCDTVPVPGYHFSRLDVYPVCFYEPTAAVWRIRSYNTYSVRFVYRVTIPGVGTYDNPELAIGTLNIPGQSYYEREIFTGASPFLPTIFKVYVNGRLQDIAIHTRRNVC